MPEQEESSSPLYKNRPEWKDVTPIYNSEEEDAVVKIAHSESFIDAFAYLRASLNNGEISERAFELTTTCAQLNPANYSVWQYRRKLLVELKKDLNAEFKFTEEMAYENQKNYQIWHHRRALVELSGDFSRELSFTESILEDDAKNYHAWQHRQWVVETYNDSLDKDGKTKINVELELAYTAQLLADDLRNNSAWSYRYFIVGLLTQGYRENDELLNRELEFAQQAIRKLILNESAWSYLNGLLLNGGVQSHPEVLNFAQNLLEKDNRSPHLRLFLIDNHVQRLEKKENPQLNATKALELLDNLETIDPTRKNYYQYLRERVHGLLANAS